MRGSSRCHRFPALLFPVLAACSHSEPFAADDFNTRVPFAAAEPARLTLSDFDDRAPAWLPDGESFLYSFVRTDTPEGDRCLGMLPRTGGQRTREICRWTPEDADSIESLDLPVVSADGRLAYLRTVAPSVNPDAGRRAIVSGTLDDPFGPVLRTLPFTTPAGALITEISEFRWVGETGIVFTGFTVESVVPCPGCDAVLVRLPAGIIHLPADGSGTVSVLPGTEDVSALAVENGQTLLVARPGDQRIYRRNLSTGEESPVHDAGGEILFLDVAGSHIMARVPGGLHIVDLSNAESTEIGAPELLRPVLNPDGGSIVGEIADSETFNFDIWRLVVP
jgi:hypothetical protein